jgi:acetyl-CoA carboxylase biotin carboxylase subunit
MIRKVLIANRGEIAIRISHTLREMGIRTVAVFTGPDADAVHTRIADEVRKIESYLDISQIIATAKECGADAIHPGYGFLSENAALSEACEAAGITFIGPRPDTIRAMGDKLESKRLMRQTGVPVVPWWDRDPPASEFPVIVKAVGGGGGKGMRLVDSPAGLKDAMASASREAAAAFGDDRVFIEKYIRQPRHIEFQILGDSNGNAIHVFERECSIQRRHQKIIEETPSPAITPELRRQMGGAAVAAARAVAYRGAGTVEFIVDASGQFYFLEMNTRLQVEHPVTEMTTGLDLVREQALIAAGGTLDYREGDIRQTGHSIECRIYAEVPEENFRPATGTIRVFEPPSGPGIRLDSGVDAGSTVSYHFDPLLAKLIVRAPSRAASINRMKRALNDFVVLGVANNIEFLGRILSTDDFIAGKLDTGFLERHPELLLVSPDIPPEALIAAEAAARPASSNVWASGPWRHSAQTPSRAPAFRLLDSSHIEIDGARHRFYVARDRDSSIVWLDGHTYYLEHGDKPHASGTVSPSASREIRTLMPGKLLRVEVAVGDTVAEKQTLATMESMKMESSLVSPKAGRISEIRCAPGQVVEMGEVIMVVV